MQKTRDFRELGQFGIIVPALGFLFDVLYGKYPLLFGQDSGVDRLDIGMLLVILAIVGLSPFHS